MGEIIAGSLRRHGDGWIVGRETVRPGMTISAMVNGKLWRLEAVAASDEKVMFVKPQTGEIVDVREGAPVMLRYGFARQEETESA